MTTSKGEPDKAGTVQAEPKAQDQQAGKGESTPAKTPATPARPATPAPGRRPGAAKEVPAFCWKVVGYSHGIPLVLFKSVEKEDAEAQFRRYREERYYRDLAIHPIDVKIPLPKDVVLAPHARPDPPKPPKKAVPRKKPAPKAKTPPAKKKTPAKKVAVPKKKKAPPKKPAKPKPKRKTAAKKPARAKAKAAKAKKPRTTTKKAASRKKGAR